MTPYNKSIAFSGGASEGIGYFKPLIEATKKKITFSGGYVATASVGDVMWIPYFCGYGAAQIFSMLYELPGDKYQKMKPSNPKEFLEWQRGIKKVFYPACEARAKESFTWGKLRSSGRIAKHTTPLIVLAKFKDLLKVIGKDLLNDIGNGKLDKPWEAIKNGDPQKLAPLCPAYGFSDDGIYRFDSKYKTLIKVSNKVVPLWKLYMMAFANSRLFNKVYYLPFDEWHRNRPFDGGMICNKANIIPGEYVSVSCVDYPTEATNKGLLSISDWNYLNHPAIEEHDATPITGKNEAAFYDLSNKRLAEEFATALDIWGSNQVFIV